MLKQYETVFIATPVLSDAQMKEAVAKYTNYLKERGAEIVYEEDWGLKQLAYQSRRRLQDSIILSSSRLSLHSSQDSRLSIVATRES